MATEEQMTAIRRKAYSHPVAQEIARVGVTLSEEQAESIGDDGYDWLCQRFDLRSYRTDDGGIRFVPRLSRD